MPKPPAPPKPKINWRLWLRIGVWTAAAATAAFGAKQMHNYLLRDPQFTLAGLDIHGATYSNRARIESVFAQDFGKSVFSAPLAERRRHLLAIDWIRTAALTRVWPNRLVITITERRPTAFAKLPVAGSTRYWHALIDDDGVLLSVPAHARFSLPLLSGINEDQTEEERRIRVDAMHHLIADMGVDAKYLSEINFASTQEARVMASVENQPVELWLGDQHYRSRFRNFVSHFGEIRARSDRASIFDLRLDDRILAK